MMIKKPIFSGGLLLLLLVLSGCATTRYGDMSTAPNQAENLIARDAIAEIHRHYPPARTQFNVLVPEKTVFDSQFISGLRAKGYAILDTRAQAASEPIKEGLALAWVLDNVVTNKPYPRYRLTLYVDDAQFDRLYQQNANTLIPAGAWSRGVYIKTDGDDE